ncbi:MAG: hypothetical protein ACOVP5_06155 [Chitinophagales bacterium]
MITCITFQSQAQIGALSVTTFVNETNNLSDNVELDSTLVRIISKAHSMDTSLWIYAGAKNRIALHPGKYQLTCSAAGRKIELEDVLVTGDRITFVDLLFEPEKKLNYKERKKRRKRYYNYMR